MLRRPRPQGQGLSVAYYQSDQEPHTYIRLHLNRNVFLRAIIGAWGGAELSWRPRRVPAPSSPNFLRGPCGFSK